MELLQVAITSVVSFLVLFFLAKIMGHRQIAQLSVFDYINGITIGSIAAELATELEKPLRPLLAMVIYALLTVLLRGETGRAYNVANRESTHTIREYAETLAWLAGVRVTFDLPTDAERQGYSVVTRAVQRPDKLEALGWKPRFSLEEGLTHTLKILSGEALK